MAMHQKTSVESQKTCKNLLSSQPMIQINFNIPTNINFPVIPTSVPVMDPNMLQQIVMNSLSNIISQNSLFVPPPTTTQISSIANNDNNTINSINSSSHNTIDGDVD